MIVEDVEVELLTCASLEQFLHPAEENKHEVTSHYQCLTGEFVICSQTLHSDDVHLRLDEGSFHCASQQINHQVNCACSHVGYCRCGLEPEPVTSAHIKHLHSILHLGLRKKIYVIFALPLIVPICSKVVWEVKEARAVLSFRLCFAVCWPSKLLIELWIEFIDSLMSHLSQMPLRGGNIYSNFPSTFS